MAGVQGDGTRGDAFEYVAAAIEANRVGIKTMEPGTVVSFDADRQECVIQLMRKIKMYKPKVGIVETLPEPLKEIPLVFPRSAGFVETFPIQPGDRVTVVVKDYDDTDWYDTGEPHAPTTRRTHDMADCIAIPRMYPITEKLTNYVTQYHYWGRDDGEQGLYQNDDGQYQLSQGVGNERVEFFAALSGFLDVVRQEDSSSKVRIAADGFQAIVDKMRFL